MARWRAGIRIGLGLLLLATAGLKLYGLGIGSIPQMGWFAHPWVQLAAAEWEIVLGLWLLSGSSPKLGWFAAVATFSAFAMVSAYLGVNGVASCGCLGAVEASPWWAFGVDVFALVLLMLARRFAVRSEVPEETNGLKWVGAVVVLMLGATLVAGACFGSPEATVARLRGRSILVPDVQLGAGHPHDVLDGWAEIENLGDQPVRIIGGSTDCSCTSIHDLPVTVAPAERVKISIRVKVPAEIGSHRRSIQLRLVGGSSEFESFRAHYRVE